jgi:hypothetical protein
VAKRNRTPVLQSAAITFVTELLSIRITVMVKEVDFNYFTAKLTDCVTAIPEKCSCWRATLCRLSVTAYSIHLQLPSIFGDRLLHPQPKDTPHHSDKGWL